MAVLELANPANPIRNNLSVVNLPLTQTRTSIGTNTQEFAYTPPIPSGYTADVLNTFNTRLDQRFYSQLFIDGGSA